MNPEKCILVTSDILLSYIYDFPKHICSKIFTIVYAEQFAIHDLLGGISTILFYFTRAKRDRIALRAERFVEPMHCLLLRRPTSDRVQSSLNGIVKKAVGFHCSLTYWLSGV